MERNTDVITADIIDVAYRIHRDLGPGLVEKIYARVAAAALRRRGYTVEKQVRITFEFEGIR
ncbi:MAG: GxxExxY protein [Longimicrobiales bacterium]